MTPAARLKASLLSEKKRQKILSMVSALGQELDGSGMVLFSGGCNDGAVLVHRETGIAFGADDSGVWMGGDYNERPFADLTYCPYVSPTAGDFIKTLESK